VGDFSCRDVADSAPAFALDILEPAARARVAAHLIRCSDCRDTVTGMQDSAARLLDLGQPWTDDAWADDPDSDDHRPPRRRLRVVLSLAAAALLLVGSTLGPELETAARNPGNPVATAVLLSGGQPVGAVRFFAGANSGIELEARGLPGKGSISVVLLTREGTAQQIGRLVVSRGQAGWFGADPVAVSDVEGIVLVDSGRNQIASAALAGTVT
jgi:hypothetical protein